MTFGARVVNQSGFTQIDQDYPTFAVSQTGTLNFSGGSGGSQVTLSYSDTGSAPIIFVKWSSQDYSINCKRVRRDSAVFFLLRNDGAPGVAAQVPYMLCTPNVSPSGPSAGDQGLVVRTASGATAFDSRVPSARVAQVITTSPIGLRTGWPSDITFNRPVANRWICISSLYGIRAVDSNGFISAVFGVACASVSQTQVRLRLLPVEIIPGSFWIETFKDRPSVLLDILNP